MPRIRHTIRFPSYRNLQIYHSLAYERITQTALAKQLGLSQVRLSQIARQVRAWVDNHLKPRNFSGNDGLRFHLAIAHERIRLRDAYEPLTGMFTGKDGWPRYLRRHVAVVNGEALNTVEVSDKPDFRLINQAVDVIGRQAELEAIANEGPFADLPFQVHQTIVHRAVEQASDLPAAASIASNVTDSANNASSNTTITPPNTPKNGTSGVLG